MEDLKLSKRKSVLNFEEDWDTENPEKIVG